MTVKLPFPAVALASLLAVALPAQSAVSVIPEPSTLAWLGAGLVGILLSRRRASRSVK